MFCFFLEKWIMRSDLTEMRARDGGEEEDHFRPQKIVYSKKPYKYSTY